MISLAEVQQQLEARDSTFAQIRLFEEAREFFETLADCFVPSISHHLIETLERYIDVAPGEVFALIA